MSFLDKLLDPFRGEAITIPPFDGAFKPNAALDTAQVLLNQQAIDNLVEVDGGVRFSSGNTLFALSDGVVVPVEAFEADISALAAMPGGALAIALDDGKLLLRGGERHGQMLESLGGTGPVSATALLALNADTLLVAQGSTRFRASDWVSALMARAEDGAVWKLDLAARRSTSVATGLAFPSGLARAGDGAILISEAFAHRVLRLEEGGKPKPVLSRIPGYPGRLSPAADGGFWLAVFAPRNRLVELVLREDRFRADMIASVPREHWIAPALSSGASFLEPLQCGAVRTMGQHKPWAPSRSYGLVTRLDAQLRPQESFHSRADGKRHGATSVLEHGGATLVALKGAGLLLDIAAGPGVSS